MAPARTAAASAAAAAEGSPEALEVRCAGCGETLEVEPGLTEFICPGCATPQSLPPELMPPPPPRRKALPLPRGAADVRGARLPCGACGSLLSVPVGLARCACPLCGAELAVDTARLRQYLLSSAATEGAVPVLPIGAPSPPPILQARVVHQEHPNYGIRAGLTHGEPSNHLNHMEHAHTKRPNQLVPEQAESDHPHHMIDGEEEHEVSEIITRHNKQRNINSVGPGVVSVEKRQEPLNQSHLEHRDRVVEEQQDPINSTVVRGPGCIALINETTPTHIDCTTGHTVGPKTVNIDKRQAQAPKDIIQHAKKLRSYYAIYPENAHTEYADGVIHVQEKQRETASQENHREEAHIQAVNDIASDSSRRRARCSVGPSNTVAEKRHVKKANEAIKQVQKQQSDLNIHMGMENQVIHVEKEQLEPFSCATRKGKRKGLIAASNSGIQLRRSKRLVKDSPVVKDKEHDKNEFLELQTSPNSQVSAAVMDTEPIHSEPVDSPDTPSTSHSKPTENDLDEQYVDSPDQSLSNSLDIDRIISNLCPSSSARNEMPEKSSNGLELDSFHLTTPPSSSQLDMSDPENFACHYIPREVRKALAKLSSNSLFENIMSQASCGEVHDLTDSEGDDDSWTPTRHNVGTKRNQGRGHGFRLCLKVWTLPKDVRIPVSLNSSGEPVGKEASTLTNFLGTIARDGILSPLTHKDWRLVPGENKDVMWHIVKLKFDIAPVGDLWIMKCLGKKWKSWKALLKQKHYDTHETEEERLADRNPRVLKEQWRFLVAYWGTEKAKAASARNKASQAKVTKTHTAGTKSFARIIEEERQKQPNKEEPTLEDLFILTHAPKNGKPMKKEMAEFVAQIRQKSHKQAKCSGSNSTAQNLRLDSCSRGPRGRKGRKAVLQASFKEAEEAKRRAEGEADTLRKKMLAMEENQKKLQEDLARLKGTASTVQNTTPTGDLRDEHTQRMIPTGNFPNELTGEPSTLPGFPQVQNAPNSHESVQSYLDYAGLYDPSASPGQQFR